MDAYTFIARHRVIMAPMAGVTDKAMRQLCREQGAQLAFTEMVSSKGLSYANRKTAHLIDLYDGERDVGVQLFGHEPETMADQAKWVEQELGDRLSVIDINMGCPARKIVSKGDGAALMKDPDLAFRIVEATAQAVSVPVSVKFRRGYETGCETAPEFAQRVEQAGASWVCVHGRYAQQMYAGESDSGTIARVKQAVAVPVIGNGDIRCGKDALFMAESTGCDAVMIARAAEGNPWVFADIAAALEGSSKPDVPTARERILMAKRHAALLDQSTQGRIVRMRKHASWYCKGLPGASAARAAFNQCTTLEDFDAVFDSLLDTIASHESSFDSTRTLFTESATTQESEHKHARPV